MSPFATVALALWQRGYSIVPLEPGDKAIKLPGWQRYCKERTNRETLDMWLGWPDRNIGLALGPASGIIALDFDYDVDGRHAEIIRIIGDSPGQEAWRERSYRILPLLQPAQRQIQHRHRVGPGSSLHREADCPAPFHPSQDQAALRMADPAYAPRYGSVTKRLLCIPVQSTYECKTRGEERWHCPP